jgi:REP element-mobilizing transposase RayT
VPADASEEAEIEGMSAFESEVVEATAADEEAITDPYIAQLALSLTEVSLELTAEATLLTREGNIVAYAGRMAREELEELRAAIDGDWDANPDEARIRFINLEGSGKDYMLFSRRTVDELTLSLVFSGTTPLRDIRRQGKRLVEALAAVPEVVAEPEPEPELADELALMQEDPLLETVEDGLARTPYAYVWLMRDPDNHLSNSIGQAIVRGMNAQLRERSWRLKDFQAKEEYVYLLADVPGETPPYNVIRDLKRRAALIAHDLNPTLDPDTLWADSYLVVTPGRKLESDEIQQYIQFERML